jgi:16S rRNA processing protein RimM
VLARAVRARGLAGEIVFRGDSEALVIIEAGEFFALRTDVVRRVQVAAVRDVAGDLGVRFEGVTGRGEAEAIAAAGALLERPASEIADPVPTWFLWGQVEGLAAVTPAGESLGVIEDRIRSSAQTVFVIRDGRREILLPAVPEFVKEFRLDAGVVVVDPPRGLVELNDAS